MSCVSVTDDEHHLAVNYLILLVSVSPSRIQSTPGSRSGTTVDAAQSTPRPVTAATLSPQSTSQTGNQSGSAQSAAGAQDMPVPAVPPRIQLSDLQNILSRLERMLHVLINLFSPSLVLSWLATTVSKSIFADRPDLE